MEPVRNINFLVMTICISIGGWMFWQGAYIYAKAALAQYLIHHSWQQTLKTKVPSKPWPWADTWPVARMLVPKHQVDLIVLAGSSGRTLAFGPGHQSASVFPGKVGNSIISAHRDTHFKFLARVRPGDEILVQNAQGVTKRFHVTEARIVNSQLTTLSLDYPSPLMTLVTCYPFDAITPGGPLRYVVFAEEVKGYNI
jgi:sortase A